MSLNDLLLFLYGNDDNTPHNSWLIRNTFAAGHCTVVSKEFASQISALDPDETFTHVQPYTPSEGGITFYTLWRCFEWRESNERVRISKAASVARSIPITQREICEHIARSTATKTLGQNNLARQLTQGLLYEASKVEFDIAKFLAYIRQLNTEAGLGIDLVSEHEHFLTPQVEVVQEQN
jgi:hypothetical protein